MLIVFPLLSFAVSAIGRRCGASRLLAFCLPTVPMAILVIILAVKRVSEAMLPLALGFAVYLAVMAIASGAAVSMVGAPIRPQRTKTGKEDL